MAGEGHAVERACRITGISYAGYYMWRLRAASERSIRHAWLLDQIIEVHAASRGTYGARRVHAELTLGRGVQVGHNAIEMLMSRAQISGLPGPNAARRFHGSSPRLISSTGTSFESNRTDCGSPTSPSTRPAKASSTAVSCSTRSAVASWAGPSITAKTVPWSPTLSAWRSPTATPKRVVSAMAMSVQAGHSPSSRGSSRPRCSRWPSTPW